MNNVTFKKKTKKQKKTKLAYALTLTNLTLINQPPTKPSKLPASSPFFPPHPPRPPLPPPTKLQIPAALLIRDPASLLIRHPAALLSSRDHHRVEPASSSPNLDELAEAASHSPMEQSQSNSQPQDNAAQNSQTGSSRGKSDPAWQYFTVKYDKNNKAQYTCIFCLNTYNGWGIYRMKYHLAKISGQIKVCNKAHCINLILKDIASLPHIADLASRASKVTAFVYNHMIFLSWLRKRKEWKEIVRPGVTRFATVFITLKSIYDHKQDLQALVIDKYFTSHKLSKSVNGKMVSSIILDSKFWEDCFTTVMLVGPLIKLLRLVDADEKPSLGIVYAGMQRAKINIKTMFRNRKSAYTPYTSILKMRWDKHLKRDLHAAAYFLNPDYFYSEGFVEKANILRSLLDLFDIKTLCDDSVVAMQEIQLYRDRKGSFGRESALKAIKRLEPGEWWRLHGGSAPNLQKMAIRLLHQTSSSSGCERNWSLFEQIHSKRRNRSEHQRLSDIVYVTYNLRLQSRMHRKKKNYDPIDIQSIDTVDFWVMPDEEDPEFTNGDIEGIENLIYTDNAMPSYPTDGGDVELDVNFPNVADSSNTASFGGTSDDGGFGLPVYDGDVGTLNDNYDF
ncbi:uncharacterized protein LOC107613746 [Arachis ipaensis]|uniref:uncharacterized protein LOC107613746 n=1 Tax=Arachis ipaensis TaxID=130454 RepID=UPI000A2B4229|nr:uncharacterized protein LOC107613746 [Arachis ipaensis]